jgi:hypothetical protein
MLYPVIGEMLRAARFAHDDSQQVKMDKLDALLAQSSTPPQDAALFAEMLSLPNDGRYPPVEVEPQLRRQKTLKALGFANRGAGADQSRAGDFRRCALGRSNQPRIVRPDGGPGREPPAPDTGYFQAGIQPALDRTAARN